jgi:tRNA1(Val) A37 N6-methylase TrmN6
MPDTPAPATLQTTEDAFLGGALNIPQTRGGSRAGLDAVFLAAACPAAPGERVLDAGTGSGIVALAVARRVAGVAVTGVEIEAGLVQLAQSNAARNGLGDRVTIAQGDVTGPATALAPAGLALESFDHVLANPPFLSTGEARLPPEPMRRRAHALAPNELARWIKFLAAFCKPKGTATIIHRADALPQLLSHLEGRFGGLTLYPLYPREGEPASRLLIQGRKASRAPLTLARGMVLHGADNAFTPAAAAILRDGAPLNVG